MGFFNNLKTNIITANDNIKKSLETKRTINALYNQQVGMFGNYKSGGAKFPNALNPVSLDFFNREQLIYRSRNLKFESTVYQSMIEWLSVYTVGTGLVPEPTPMFSMIKNISEEQKKQIRIKIEGRFALILKSKKIHEAEYYDFSELQKKIFESYITDGEVFVLLNYKHATSKNDFVLCPVRLQMIPAENIRNSYLGQTISTTKSTANGYTADGIEYDESGKIINYSVMIQARDTSSMKPVTFRFETIEAETPLGQKRIIQMSNRNQPNDLRGIPVCYNIFHELENVMTAIIAELDAQKNAAMIFGVVERDNPDVIKSNGFTAAANFAQREVDSLNTPPVTTRLNTPGTVINSLNPGEKFNQLTTDRPNTNIPSFIYDILKPICASKGIPVEVLYGLFSSNYSASRAAIQQFWAAIEQYRATFISQFLSDFYKSVLTELVYSGEIDLPQFTEDGLVREAWLSHRWNGSAQPSLDPTQDYEAAEMAINLGFASHEQMARELHGSNYSSVLESLAAEKEKRRELKLLKENEREESNT